MRRSFIRLALTTVAVILLGGCTAVTVRPVDKALGVKHVCIQDCSDRCFDGDMLGIIRDGFERHGISSQIYTGNVPDQCEYHLTYMCNRTWDLSMYMHHAELSLYRGRNQIGFAEYHLKQGGGLALTKFQSTKSKMDPVIDELMTGKSPE
jgi:hypothetical protein